MCAWVWSGGAGWRESVTSCPTLLGTEGVLGWGNFRDKTGKVGFPRVGAAGIDEAGERGRAGGFQWKWSGGGTLTGLGWVSWPHAITAFVPPSHLHLQNERSQIPQIWKCTLCLPAYPISQAYTKQQILSLSIRADPFFMCKCELGVQTPPSTSGPGTLSPIVMVGIQGAWDKIGSFPGQYDGNQHSLNWMRQRIVR